MTPQPALYDLATAFPPPAVVDALPLVSPELQPDQEVSYVAVCPTGEGSSVSPLAGEPAPAEVAQPVEQAVRTRQVAGSTPALGSIESIVSKPAAPTAAPADWLTRAQATAMGLWRKQGTVTLADVLAQAGKPPKDALRFRVFSFPAWNCRTDEDGVRQWEYRAGDEE